jgi:hypothetical protein
MHYCCIGDAGAKSLAATLPRSSVTTLSLFGNKIGDAGAKALAAALPGSSVTNLDFYNNNIG